MPLLNICSTTPDRQTFSIAAIFLPGETEANYRWALQQLVSVATQEGIQMPRITVTDREIALIKAIAAIFGTNTTNFLCRWHVNKNVLAKTKPFFPKATRNANNQVIRAPQFTEFLNAWNSLVTASNEASFNELYSRFCNSPRHPKKAKDYCIKTWLPWKGSFVSYLVDQHRHFGHTTTSAVEGLHASMKKFLWSSTGDLTNYNKQHKITTFTLQLIYIGIREKVASYALVLLTQRHKGIMENGTFKNPGGYCDDRQPCGPKSSFGLPCQHDIYHHLRTREAFELTDFDEFWHVRRDAPDSTAPLEPLTVRGKGRPRGLLAVERAV
ncbi:hypothetical protein CDD82_2369 [Ophiocordyceps australis]|uniref:MULE transposase domain-containing protein n=1 Tax=Ophiocordyceps australis TaxID=1399860 RepID=A0A2C5XZC1_9HYPO|nr:hypothetical protein CDD82_2369 [Ophiocordyceps australis]